MINAQSIDQWEKCKQFNKVIGRMYSVSPAQNELVNLRLIIESKKSYQLRGFKNC